MSDTLELTDLDQQMKDDLVLACKFRTRLVTGQILVCDKPCTHLATLDCGQVHPCCPVHAQQMLTHKIMCIHGPCRLKSVERL
jgi:hypothetical protein